MEKSTFGVIVGTRGFFNPKLANEGRKQFLKKLEDQGYSYVIIEEEDVPYGCIETESDAEKCAEIFKKNAEIIDGIIITLPNFGDEIGAVESIRLSKLNVPILVHAFDDELDRMDLAHRRDAFCGKLSVCNNLYQCGMKFTDTTYHTTSLDSQDFLDDLARFDQICRIYGGIKGAKIAQIGTRPTAFRTVRFSEKLFERFGITVVSAELSELFARANSIQDLDAIEKMKMRIKEYGAIDCTGFVCDEASGIDKSARFTIAVEQWMRENHCVAGTIQCWNAIEKNYHCAPCLTMSMLGETGIPFACETDVQGAIAMYALYLADGAPSAYLDWNNSFGSEKDMCINFHCSNYPKSFFDTVPVINCLDILGNSLGHDNCFGALKAQVKSGDFTFANIETDDYNGKIKMYVGEGQFTDDVVHTVGSPAVCKIEHLQDLMHFMCKNGYHHHVAMNRGHHADAIQEVFENYFGWSVYRHNEENKVY